MFKEPVQYADKTDYGDNLGLFQSGHQFDGVPKTLDKNLQWLNNMIDLDYIKYEDGFGLTAAGIQYMMKKHDEFLMEFGDLDDINIMKPDNDHKMDQFICHLTGNKSNANNVITASGYPGGIDEEFLNELNPGHRSGEVHMTARFKERNTLYDTEFNQHVDYNNMKFKTKSEDSEDVGADGVEPLR